MILSKSKQSGDYEDNFDIIISFYEVIMFFISNFVSRNSFYLYHT